MMGRVQKAETFEHVASFPGVLINIGLRVGGRSLECMMLADGLMLCFSRWDISLPFGYYGKYIRS